MITGKDSFKKGFVLFIKTTTIATCIFATFATGITVLQTIAIIALASIGVMAYSEYKNMSK